ncbi:hypothetical protein QQ020_11895 [Fulvivirgaceae bacterium BMA12]|uniref:Uncharacterized protein n=1 Tax=Agaribacillus aureus TaxID=3051825 RepID=A0ABT8L4R6_9BACT|nr:hypothetical protein [Fulvivirgaceae bacterium BMA12]
MSCASNTSHAYKASADEVESKDGLRSLFNGKDLSGWYTYLRPPEPTSEVDGLKDRKYVKHIGLNEDPLNIFTVVQEDGSPAIRISGEVPGVLITKEEYENLNSMIN